MIKFDVSRKLWIDTENPEWDHDLDEKLKRFPPDTEFPETFKNKSKFFDWLNGRKLKHITIGFACYPARTIPAVPFHYKLNLHPIITTDEFSWGVPLDYEFEYWYDAHKGAERVVAYMNDVLRTSRRNIFENWITYRHNPFYKKYRSWYKQKLEDAMKKKTAFPPKDH